MSMRKTIKKYVKSVTVEIGAIHAVLCMSKRKTTTKIPSVCKQIGSHQPSLPQWGKGDHDSDG